MPNATIGVSATADPTSTTSRRPSDPKWASARCTVARGATRLRPSRSLQRSGDPVRSDLTIRRPATVITPSHPPSASTAWSTAASSWT
jgi:hypothetical protein